MSLDDDPSRRHGKSYLNTIQNTPSNSPSHTPSGVLFQRGKRNQAAKSKVPVAVWSPRSEKRFSACIILEESAQKTIRLSIRTSSREPEDRRLYLALGGGPDREPGKSVPKKGGKRAFLAHFFLFKRIILFTNFGPDSQIDGLGGNFIRGFSMKTYPDFYSPNIPSLNKYQC